jgi:hypothetical protein
MHRWHDRKLIARSFVEFNGKAVKSVKAAFASATTLAKLSGTAHEINGGPGRNHTPL